MILIFLQKYYSLRDQKIAFPIQLGCEFLFRNLRNEGIFRLVETFFLLLVIYYIL